MIEKSAPQVAVLLLLTTLISPIIACAEKSLAPYTGDSKAFTLNDLQDQQHTQHDYRGKVVLVNFWASWCPPCIYEMPELTRLKNRLTDQPFEILAINVGEKKYKVRKFARLINFDLPILLDTSKDTFNAWNIKTLPTSFLIDAEGNFRYRVRGNPGWDEADTIKVIEQLISEDKIEHVKIKLPPLEATK